MQFNLKSVSFPFDQYTGFAAGEYGIIVKTTNGGASWSYLNTGTTTDFSSVIFPGSAQVGWAAGTQGRVIKTVNGGETWARYDVLESIDINDIYFYVDLNTGWAACNLGKIYKTVNGGRDWVQQTTSTSSNIKSICFPIDVNVGYAVGENGLVLTTNDGGTTWTASNSGTSYAITSLSFPDGNNIGFATGENNLNLMTDTGGSTWNPHGGVTPGNYMNAIEFTSVLIGYKVGLGGEIYKTVARDANNLPVWAELVSGTENNLYDVDFPDNGVAGYAVGQAGVILKTVDSGATWEDVSVDTSVPMGSFEFVPEAGSHTEIIVTKNVNVVIRLLSVNAQQIILSRVSDFSDGLPPYSVTDSEMYVAFELMPGDGEKTVYAKFVNTGTGQHIEKFKSVQLDTVAPVPTEDESRGIYPIEGPVSTLSPNIQLRLRATDPYSNIIYVMISNRSDFSGGTEIWQVLDVDAYYNWTLEGSANQYKQVYAKFMDLAGNVSSYVSTIVAWGDMIPPSKVTGSVGEVVGNIINLSWLAVV